MKVRVAKYVQAEADFWCGGVAVDGRILKKCQNGVRDLDIGLENEVKVERSRIFN